MKTKNKHLEKFAGEFAELMISRIRVIEKDWSKPWLSSPRRNFIPRNINGRKYRGGNAFMLLLHLMEKGYSTPVFLTFLQAKKLGLTVNKGSKSFPVYYYVYAYLDKETKDRITREEYDQLPESEKKKYFMVCTPKFYSVFNLEQTNFAEERPEKWQELLDYYNVKIEDRDDSGMITCQELDNMLVERSWVCPVDVCMSDRAYFSPSQDLIVCPLKRQFKEGEGFYSTLLHEMTHSTGTAERLNRLKKAVFGDENYAREELVAELSSALSGFYLGISANIRSENAAYLKSWLKELKKDPEYLMNVLADCTKAVGFIISQLGVEHVFDDEPQIETVEDEKAETLLQEENK